MTVTRNVEPKLHAGLYAFQEKVAKPLLMSPNALKLKDAIRLNKLSFPQDSALRKTAMIN